MHFFDFAWVPDPRIFIAMAAGLGVTVYCIAIIRKYVRIVIDVMDNQAWVPENGNGDLGAWVGREVQFSATDGHPLCGVYMRGARSNRARRKERGAVIFAHEFASDRSIATRYCRPLAEQGFDVLAFDFRGHGASTGQAGYHPRQWPSDRETADMSGAIQFVSDYLVGQNRPPRIALFGLSRGACSAILAAPKHGEVCAIVADGAYSSDTATEYFMKRFATIFARLRFIARSHPPVFWKLMRVLLFREYRRRSGCNFPSVRKAIMCMGRMPVLFIHGEKDSYIPVAQSQGLYDLAHGPKSIWIVPDARHNQCVKIDPAGYFRRIVGFLDEHVSTEHFPVHVSPAWVRCYDPSVTVPSSSLAPTLVSSQT
jgi:pimeloyl-ACP methyl ester carboxylesterase